MGKAAQVSSRADKMTFWSNFSWDMALADSVWLEFRDIPLSAQRAGPHPSQADLSLLPPPNKQLRFQVSKANPVVGNPWKWHAVFWWELKGVEWPTGFSAGEFVILLIVALNLRLALHKHSCCYPTYRTSFFWWALSWPGPISPRGEDGNQFLARTCKSWHSLTQPPLPELSSFWLMSESLPLGLGAFYWKLYSLFPLEGILAKFIVVKKKFTGF